MTPQRIRDMLRSTLEDYRLSRGEQSALRQIFEHLDFSPQDVALYRSVAFDLAREVLDASNAAQVMDWLEEVAKLLVPATTAEAVEAEACFGPGDHCPQRIAGLLNRCRASADICVFTITDDRISSAILDAHRRKIAVRIVTDDEKATDRGSDIVRLSEAGVPVRIDNTPFHMHHKFALFDGRRLLTGSYNWTRSAARENEENFIVTGDARLVSAFGELFESLWEKFS